jgi:hypothetical protein
VTSNATMSTRYVIEYFSTAGGSFTWTFPTPSFGVRKIIKDVGGALASHPITLASTAGIQNPLNLASFPTTLVLDGSPGLNSYASLEYAHDGTHWVLLR